MKRGVMAIAIVMTAIVSSGCDKLKEKMSGGDGGTDASVVGNTGTTTNNAPPGKKEEENLFSAGSGAMVVSFEPKNETNYDEWQLLDDNPTSYWMPGGSAAKSYKLTLVLPQPTTVKKMTFHGGAKKITVEATPSAQAKDGFVKIAEATLVGTKEAGFPSAKVQDIAVSNAMQARAYRVTFEITDGLFQNNELRAFGTKHAEPTFATDITGSYEPMESSLGTLRVKQTGNLVAACVGGYELTGEVEGGLVKGTWWTSAGTKEPAPAALNVTPDGKQIVFLRYAGNALFKATGPKKSASPGTCPLWKDEKAAAPPVDPIAADIERFGRTRIYGIKFDTDSDVPKPESKAVIDRVVTVLKAKPDWKITVEGHTDNTATADYNQGLSDRRAKAVKKALETAGIAPARLEAKGFGQTKPIAPNETSLGRAENRRVELAKQ
jgi:OmpA-OmpF porin, OOP family